MFQFLSMNPYEQRKIGRDDFEWGLVSTTKVNDGAHDYETAVGHREYNSGKLVIVDAYDSREDAEAGHKKWVKTMTAKKLPESLTDCSNSEIRQIGTALGIELTFPRQQGK